MSLKVTPELFSDRVLVPASSVSFLTTEYNPATRIIRKLTLLSLHIET